MNEESNASVDSLEEWLDAVDKSGASNQHRIECAGLNEILYWVAQAFKAGRDSVKLKPLCYDEICIILDKLDAKGTPWNESPVSFTYEIEKAHKIQKA